MNKVRSLPPHSLARGVITVLGVPLVVLSP